MSAPLDEAIAAAERQREIEAVVRGLRCAIETHIATGRSAAFDAVVSGAEIRVTLDAKPRALPLGAL